MNKKLITPSFLKQKAKQLKRDHSLKQHQALDLAAREFGFINYKNYQNTLESGLQDIETAKKALLKSIFSEEDESKKTELASSLIKGFKIPFDELFDIIAQIQQSIKCVQVICERSNMKADLQKSLLTYFVDSKDDVQAFPLREHFVVKSVTVKNLTFEFHEGELHVNGDYAIEFKFEYEVPDDQKHFPHFSHEPMFGDFEATIGRDRKIIIEEASIGEKFDGEIFMSSFRLGRH